MKKIEKILEKTLKALANRRRLGILQYLKENREASVTEIAAAIHLSFKATSKHLGILASLDIVDRDQRRLQMFYRLSQDQSRATKSILYLL